MSFLELTNEHDNKDSRRMLNLKSYFLFNAQLQMLSLVVLFSILILFVHIFLHSPFCWNRPLYNSVRSLPNDYGWTPVIRHGSTCESTIHGFSEGFGTGFPAFDNSGKNVSYGCWFYLLPVAEVYINVGRSLRMLTRRDVAIYLNSSCVRTLNDLQCYTHSGDNDWCTLASRLGFDSIMIAQSHATKIAEIVTCTGECMTEPVTGTCPPVPMKKEDKSECDCNNKSVLLTCTPNSFPHCKLMNKYMRDAEEKSCHQQNSCHRVCLRE